MTDNRAYTFDIDPIGTSDSEFNRVHQVSPAWLLTFVRWENRDTLRNANVASTEVRDPLIVENDCLSVTTTGSKGALTPSMTATLVMTDVNYLTAIAPGDFVLVNMLNWEAEAKRVAQKAFNKQAINGPTDGFKGIFKVQGVREIETTDPQTGTKIVLFKINGFAFTEFNNTIYFNPYLIDPNQDKKNELLFASFIGKDWANLVGKKGLTNVQDVIAVLIQSFIGTGIQGKGQADKSGLKTHNVHFFIPDLVGRLLGVQGAKAAKDIYIYLFGIQKYASGSAQSVGSGTNPAGIRQKFKNFWYTPTECQGDTLLKAEYWNQIKTWAILNQYTNAPLNEMYTAFRTDPGNKVMPTLVFRQMPFSTEDFKGAANTKFLNLPRWKVNPALIMDKDLGREEAARVNFVQYFGRSSVGQEGADIAQQLGQVNYVYDIKDVQRSGLRPYIVTTQFDEPTTIYKNYRSPGWARVMGNILIGGHLKLNGTITCAGLVDPIAVGDNLELDSVVYHIEQITHSAAIVGPKGARQFRSVINVSSGISIDSSAKGTRYAEMTNTAADLERKRDFDNEEMLPGVSESQDIIKRHGSVDAQQATNKSFPQPAFRSFRKKKKAKK